MTLHEEKKTASGGGVVARNSKYEKKAATQLCTQTKASLGTSHIMSQATSLLFFVTLVSTH